jgi:hypothetical protein
VRRPRVVPDEDHEVGYERVAAVDVAKAAGVVCLRIPDSQRPGRFVNQIWITCRRPVRGSLSWAGSCFGAGCRW